RRLFFVLPDVSPPGQDRGQCSQYAYCCDQYRLFILFHAVHFSSSALLGILILTHVPPPTRLVISTRPSSPYRTCIRSATFRRPYPLEWYVRISSAFSCSMPAPLSFTSNSRPFASPTAPIPRIFHSVPSTSSP